MPLNVPCPCGNVLTVSEGAAGTEVTCGCGKMLVVPSLRARPSPEKAVQALLLMNRLPIETQCVLCGTATDHTVHCRIECEKAVVLTNPPPPPWLGLLAVVTCSWPLLILTAIRHAQSPDSSVEYGKDRIYDLPLRVCPGCRPRLIDATETTQALRRVPLYSDLLDQYPRATVHPPAP